MKSFAFVFPGQGSQSVGMLDAWGDHPVIAETLAEASSALGENLALLIREGPKEALALTTNTQPVMLAAGVAVYRAWMEETGWAPAAVAGHSLGEYAALVAAGAMSLTDAVPLVRFRAQAMQNAVPVDTGAMAAIMGMAAADVIARCAQASSSSLAGSGEVVEAVNFNDPAQTVIAGSKAAVDRACDILKANGAKRTILLAVSAPFHSSLMKPAAEHLRERLLEVKLTTPKIPLVNNADVLVETDVERIRDALYRQAFGPVRWVECVLALKQFGLSTVVECGPGKVLAGLVRRIDAEMTGISLADPPSLATLKESLA